MLPALEVGYSTDDYAHELRLNPASDLAGFGYAPEKLFEFVGDADARDAAVEEGTLSWWTHPQAQLSFFRPLSIATHRVDHAVAPSNPSFAYLHSIAWFALLLVALALLYQRLSTPGVALIAFAVFALDDVHGPTVGFIANRNAIIAAFFGAVTLIAHDRWRRDNWKLGEAIGPVAFGLALLAGEAGVTVAGFLVAYAVTMEEGTWRERARSSAGYVLVGFIWAGIYSAGHYGSRFSGVYTDPVAEPLRFAADLLERAPVLFLGQFSVAWSEFWALYPPHIKPIIWMAGVVHAVLGVALLWPLLRRQPEVRFWALAGTLSLVPVCATIPSDRLLFFSSMAAAPVIAAAIATLGPAAAEFSIWRRRGMRTVGVLFVLVHLVISPLMLPLRAQSMATVNRALTLLDTMIPTEESVTERTLIVISAPSDGIVSYVPIARAATDVHRPRRLRLLATAPTGGTVTRIDANTLEVRPDLGLLSAEAEQMLRATSDPMEAGDTVELSDVIYEVVELNEAGRPAAIRAAFDVPLEDPRFIWLVWSDVGFREFEVPSMGESVRYERVPDDVAVGLVLGTE
ncbi:MAG: multisubunit Na+/H+ antiporter MnhB subunit [Bradymonadia bacterium]|jgi:multisubunit Na+/H+ antiporter MnhB subunit